jgi:HAMP domain-containing protein
MIRTRIILSNLVIVFLFAGGSYFVLSSYFEDLFMKRVQEKIHRERTLFERSKRLQAIDFVENVVQRARHKKVKELFKIEDSREQQFKAHAECEAFNAWFQKPENKGSAAEFIAITDEKGVVISRNIDPTALYKKDLAARYSAIKEALKKGTPKRDIWKFNGRMLDTAISPIYLNGEIKGALIVGFDIDDGVALEDKNLFNMEFVYFIENRIHSSSFTNEEVQDLKRFLFKKEKLQSINYVLQSGRPSKPFRVKILDEEFMGVIARVPGEHSNLTSGYIMLTSLTAAYLPIKYIGFWILIFCLIATIGTITVGFILASYFMKPIEQIEGGLSHIIAGDHKYRFNIKSSELGGLASTLNTMIDSLLGIEEKEEVEEKEEWEKDLFVEEKEEIEEELKEELAKESEEEHLKRIYREYTLARKEIGLEIEDITPREFIQKLSRIQENIKRRHNCRLVRFQIEVKSGQVAIKHIPIK